MHAAFTSSIGKEYESVDDSRTKLQKIIAQLNEASEC